jgi:hypothetical protein
MASDLTGVEMQTRREPKFYSFGADGVREGEVLEGVFLRIDSIEKEGKKVARFLFAEGEIHDGRFVPSGERFALLATYDLAQKLLMGDTGHFVRIRYTGEDHSVRTAGNALKRFDVQVSAAEFVTARGISDQDIPF